MHSYPHMCRDDHIEIGHRYSGDDERCPLCQLLAALEHVTELLVDTWDTEMDDDPEDDFAVINARAVIKALTSGMGNS